MTLTETFTGIAIVLVAITIVLSSASIASERRTAQSVNTAVYEDITLREAALLSKFYAFELHGRGGFCPKQNGGSWVVGSKAEPVTSLQRRDTVIKGEKLTRDWRFTFSGPHRGRSNFGRTSKACSIDSGVSGGSQYHIGAPFHLANPSTYVESYNFSWDGSGRAWTDGKRIIRTAATVTPQPPVIESAKATIIGTSKTTAQARIEVFVPWGTGPINVSVEALSEEDFDVEKVQRRGRLKHAIKLKGVEPPADFLIIATNPLGRAETRVHLRCPKQGLTGMPDKPKVPCQRDEP